MKRLLLLFISSAVVTVCVAPIPTAAAGEGDFVQNVQMKNTEEREGPSRYRWVRTETWNSNDKGQRSCTSVGEIGYWVHPVCSQETTTGYKEAYCTTYCDGELGWHALIEDASGFTSYFTGWERYESAAAPLAGAQPLHDAEVPPFAEGVSEITSLPARIMSSFALFRRPEAGVATTPPEEATAFAQATGASWPLARQTPARDGVEAWVVPGDGTLCIEARAGEYGGGATCAPVDDAVEGELGLTSADAHTPGYELVAGVMPDGVTSVTFRLADNTAQVVPVIDNVYGAVVHGAVISIDAVLPRGLVTLASAPADAPRVGSSLAAL